MNNETGSDGKVWDAQRRAAPKGEIRVKGVVAYLEEQGDQTRLTYDDVACSTESGCTSWEKTILYTSAKYPSRRLATLSLTKEQYAEIGENLVMRLLALNGKIE